MFENFNVDGLFFPVISFSAGVKLVPHEMKAHSSLLVTALMMYSSKPVEAQATAAVSQEIKALIRLFNHDL